jgi:hypothetical protein
MDIGLFQERWTLKKIIQVLAQSKQGVRYNPSKQTMKLFASWPYFDQVNIISLLLSTLIQKFNTNFFLSTLFIELTNK